MAAVLNWIDTLFFGVRRIFAAGSEMPERPALNFIGPGVSVTDDPANNRTNVTIAGGVDELTALAPPLRGNISLAVEATENSVEQESIELIKLQIAISTTNTSTVERLLTDLRNLTAISLTMTDQRTGVAETWTMAITPTEGGTEA